MRGSSLRRPLKAVALLVLALGLVAVPSAGASSYTNPAPISLPVSGPGSVYPSTISVSGLPGAAVQLTASVNGINHNFPRDIDALLVAPNGSKTLLFSDVCGDTTTPFSGTTLTLDDAAANSFPDPGGLGPGPCPTGSYKPLDLQPGPGNDTFPAPAPAGPYTAKLGDLTGGPANGSWQLFIQDDAAGTSGAVTGGWSLNLLPQASCAGKAATVAANVGTAGDDTITGTAGDDVIVALGGNDTVRSGAGKDVVCGGDGKDKLFGEAGKDKLLGEAGKDKLKGGGGKDVCKGGGARDTAAACETEKSI